MEHLKQRMKAASSMLTLVQYYRLWSSLEARITSVSRFGNASWLPARTKENEAHGPARRCRRGKLIKLTADDSRGLCVPCFRRGQKPRPLLRLCHVPRTSWSRDSKSNRFSTRV